MLRTKTPGRARASVREIEGKTPCGTNMADQMRMAHEKRLMTARARAALCGIALYVIDDDAGKALYIATQQALTRSFDALEDVERWLDQIGRQHEQRQLLAPAGLGVSDE